jgi:hypothetical protein
MRRIAALAAFALVAAAATGCSTYRTREFPAGRTASTFLGASTELGLTVAAEALVRPVRSERYLWFDCVAYGYLPVVVRIKNGGNASFRLDRANVKCVLGDGTTFEVAPIDQVIEDLRYSGGRAFPSFLLGIIPGVFHLIHINATNADLRADYEEKHLFVDRDALQVGADDRLTGVIFFRLAEGVGHVRLDLANALLEVRVTKERGPEGGDVEDVILRPQVEYTQ